MKPARLPILLLVLLMLVPAAWAQTTSGQETSGEQQGDTTPVTLNINLDTPTSISLGTEAPVILNYKGSANETVTITARSLEEANPVDPIIMLTDSGGTELASNDDHRTNRTDLAPRDSLIADFTLPAAGRYSIVVTSYDGAGDVEVLITHESGGASTTTETTQQTSSGDETLEGEVPDGDAYTHETQANEGEALTIIVRATDNQLDPKVSLIDSAGIVLTDNDDHNSVNSALGPYDSEIPGFVIPETGTYTIEITGFAGIGGTFELTIIRGDGSQTSPTPQPSGDEQVFEGTVEPNDYVTHAFTADAGDVFVITAQALNSDLDPRVALYFDNDYITDNDDYGSNDSDLNPTDARLYNLIIQESGEYEVDVSGYQDSSGDYRLTIERVATGAPTGTPDEQIEIASVNAGQTFSLDFEAEAGDYVTIAARGLSFNADSYIALLDANGSVLIDNDDHGGGSAQLAFYDSQIPNFIITESGTYTVELSSATGESSTFGLTIGILR